MKGDCGPDIGRVASDQATHATHGAATPSPPSGECPSRGAVIDICERFIGQVLLRRDFTEEVSGPTWLRLKHTPVMSIEPQDGLATDIDSSGDGWVRVTDGDTERTVRYTAGMAKTLGDIPEPLKQGIERLERHLDEEPDTEPPAAVTALWRPYRRLRLS